MPDHYAFYDPDCGFCRWCLSLLLRADRGRRLRPVALGTPEADELLAELTPEQRMASWHLVSPDGEVSSAGAGLSAVTRLLPGGRPIAILLDRVPAPTERAYAWIADNRTTLSRFVPGVAKRRATDRITARRAGEG